MLAALSAALCAAAGAYAGMRLGRRARRLRQWQQALLAIQAACAYARAPISRALLAGAEHIPYLKPLGERVEAEGADAWALFRALPRDPLLASDEWAVLCACMEALSRGDMPAQRQAFEYALARFSAFCEDAEGKRGRDARLYVTLGCLGGACAFLLLI